MRDQTSEQVLDGQTTPEAEAEASREVQSSNAPLGEDDARVRTLNSQPMPTRGSVVGWVIAILTGCLWVFLLSPIAPRLGLVLTCAVLGASFCYFAAPVIRARVESWAGQRRSTVRTLAMPTLVVAGVAVALIAARQSSFIGAPSTPYGNMRSEHAKIALPRLKALMIEHKVESEHLLPEYAMRAGGDEIEAEMNAYLQSITPPPIIIADDAKWIVSEPEIVKPTIRGGSTLVFNVRMTAGRELKQYGRDLKVKVLDAGEAIFCEGDTRPTAPVIQAGERGVFEFSIGGTEALTVARFVICAARDK